MHMGMMIVCVNEAVCVCVFVLLLCLIYNLMATVCR